MTYAPRSVHRPLRSLIVVRTLPDPTGGGADLRRLGIVRALTTLGPVTVFGLGPGGAPVEPGPGRTQPVWAHTSDPTAARGPRGSELTAALDRGVSPFAPTTSTAAVAELLATAAELEPDVVVVSGLELVRYAEAIRPHAPWLVIDLDYAQAHATLDLATADRNGRRAMLWRLAAANVATDESTALGLADQVWIGHADEIARFGTTSVPPAFFAVVPNAIESASYGRAQRTDPDALVFPARFDFWPNEDAARELLDKVLPRLQGAHLCLVGRAPPAWLQARADDHVTVTGAVSDVRPHLRAAAAMPIPLRAGAGTRFKVLEAFATGLPVVSTAKGVEGLGLTDTIHYLRAETADDFTAALDDVRHDTRQARECIEEASALLEREFSQSALEQAVAMALSADPMSRT